MTVTPMPVNRRTRSVAAQQIIEQLRAARNTIVAGVDQLIETVERFDLEVGFSQEPTTSLEPLMDRKETAKLVKVSEAVVSDWVARGMIPCRRLPAGSEDASRDIIRFDRNEILRWLDQRSAGAA